MPRLPWLLLVVAAAVLPHLGSLRGGFHYDDDHVILLNRGHLEDPGSIVEMFRDPSVFSGSPGNRIFRPVSHASHVLDARLSTWTETGPDPLPWHVTNLLLHALVAASLFVLLHRVLRQWFPDAPEGERGALLAALLGAVWFAMHPVNSEVVNYVTSRSESLAALFFLASLVCFHRAWDDDLRGPGRLGGLSLSVLFALLSFGSKETGVLLPLVAMALEIWGRRREAGPLERVKSAAVRAAPLLAIVVFYLLLRRSVLDVAVIPMEGREATGLGSDPLNGGGRSFLAHGLTQCRVLVMYGLLVLFPVDLAPDHAVRVSASFADVPTLLAMALVLAVAVAVLRSLKKGDCTLPLVAAWAALAAAPSVLIPLNVLMNEHRLYLPMTGLALGAGLLLRRLLLSGASGGRPLFPAAAVAVMLLAFAAIDVDRSRDWSDAGRLWERAVVTSPNSWRNHLHRAVEWFRRGERKIIEAERAPGDIDGAALEEGTALLDRSMEGFRVAHDLYPGSFEACLNLGYAHMLRGRIRNRMAHPDAVPPEPEDYLEAADWFARAEKASPASFRALYNRATCLAFAGRVDEAIEAFEVLAQDTSRTTMYAYPLAQLYRRRGQWEESLGWLDRALEVEPDDAGIIALQKGEVLTQAGRFDEADEQLLVAFGIFGMDDPLPGVYKCRLLAAQLAAREDDGRRVLLRRIWERVTGELGYRPGPKDAQVLRILAAR